MKVVKADLLDFQEKIEKNIPFSLARYGDGEWFALLGHRGRNCDGVAYSDELQKALHRTLAIPRDYYYGILAVAIRTLGAEIERYSTIHNINIPWIDATFLVSANRNGHLREFISALQKKVIIYVGPEHLQRVNFLPIKHFIVVHPTQAFAERQSTIEKILKNSNKGDLIGFSAGPATKVMIHELYPKLGDSHTLFDFGSVWDGYLGIPSRKYMRRKSWKEIMKRNLA